MFGGQGSGFRVQGSGFRGQGSGFRVQGSGFGVQGSEFRVQGSGFRVYPAALGNMWCRAAGVRPSTQSPAPPRPAAAPALPESPGPE